MRVNVWKEKGDTQCLSPWLTLVYIHGAGILDVNHIDTAWIQLPSAGEDGRGPLDQPARSSEVVIFHVVEISAKSWMKKVTLAAIFMTSYLKTQTNVKNKIKSHLWVSL